jgi:Raf kinase inhibitor-like YbhB/YbcL family protein
MPVKMGIKLQSPAFNEGERIPDKYTCVGENISPPLTWGGIDATVRSWVLIIDDPDAQKGTFTHWVIFNIPAGAQGLPEGLLSDEKLQSGAIQGMNDTMKTGYAGPCPPPGSVHHYQFNIYALDTVLTLQTRATKNQVLGAMNGHTVSQGRLTGIFQRT